MCYSHRISSALSDGPPERVAGCTVMDAIVTLPSDIADEKIRHM